MAQEAGVRPCQVFRRGIPMLCGDVIDPVFIRRLQLGALDPLAERTQRRARVDLFSVVSTMGWTQNP